MAHGDWNPNETDMGPGARYSKMLVEAVALAMSAATVSRSTSYRPFKVSAKMQDTVLRAP